MFGYMLFKKNEQPYKTPPEFQQRAREDIENHLRNLSSQTTITDRSNTNKNNAKSSLIQRHTEKSNNDIVNKNSSPLTYGSSPLRNTLTVSNNTESVDEYSSIDSGKSGCSLSHESAQILLNQQQESLNRLFSRTSTQQNSLFTNDINSLYTSNTLNTNTTQQPISMNNVLPLNEALPKDFSDYYSPDLDVDKFSNGRPIIQYLVHSDIYKEAKLDLEFREKTATFIVQRARLRHRQILIDSFNIDPSAFNPETHLLGDIKLDCYFKFEWRNIIENYLLNLGIENECRIEFKSRISKLKKITQDKGNIKGKSSLSLKNNLYKKVLLENKSAIDETLKINIWKEVKANVYKMLNMDGLEVS
ncbi:hypothetical protein CANINC_003647 [Pichia inconspicua]|uniref:Uncharacterized protein n=1 Tax=Pichia inconspicua TaxID=52247 RepID=A0A4T0WY62_9ASCO|nr:hypothetical protein CANINC_003647 [[Candida] inconspicua]